MDLWTIVTGAAVVVGLIVGLFQVVEYMQKFGGKKAAEPPSVVETPAPVPKPAQAPVQEQPPLPASNPTSLPEPGSPLIGRDREISAVCDLLSGEGRRLVTLTGPGGTGKTRLGWEVARRLLPDFPGGVYMVQLAPLKDPDLVLPTVAQTLGVKEQDDRPLLERLSQRLAGQPTLLLLDNFEQIVDAAPVVSQLLAAAPMLKMVVTSRSLLRLTGEHEFPVPPLDLPDLNRLPRLEMLSRYESVALFVERAQAARPYFALTNENAPAVAEICVRLDGLPLAIELAAARVKLLTPQAMLERLTSRLQLLTGGARDLPSRQQTLRNAIDWSHDLLDPSEMLLFRRLAVFAGGCTIESAERVCAGPEEDGTAPLNVLEGLGSLVEKSLLRQETMPDGAPRFHMLETIREYAQEKLAASGEAGALETLHASHFLALAEEAEPKLRGLERQAWLARLDAENDNFRAAIDRSLAAGQAQVALRLAGALGSFWLARGYITEGRERAGEALAAAGSSPDEVTAKALIVAGKLAFTQCDYDEAQRLYDTSLPLWRAAGDERGITLALDSLGSVAVQQGDYDAARTFYEESLSIWRQTGNTGSMNASLNNLAIIATRQGDFATARDLLTESLEHFRRSGDTQGTAAALNNLGNVLFSLGEYAEAARHLDESLAIERQLSSKVGIARALGNLAKAELRRGDPGRAGALFEESLTLRMGLGDKLGIARCLAGLGAVRGARGDGDTGAALLAAADSLLGATGTRLDLSDRAEYDRYLEEARNRLGSDFAAAWEKGRALSVEDAATLALGAPLGH